MGNKVEAALLSHGFNLNKYEETVLEYGLSDVWNFLTSYLIENGVDAFSKNIVDFYDIGRLYEIGLAIENKYSKKEAGKYYTPRDVSKLMADLLIENDQLNCVADVGCGCGNLIIEVLSKIKERSLDEFNNVISNLYLFDLDKTAINICKARITAMFGIDANAINDVCGDFLSKTIKVPNNCYIISNPPYSQIKEIKKNWEYKTAITESKDLYVGFIEKIIRSSKKAVIVSPQSYIVGSKFEKIRNILFEKGNGDIYSFDNVPGTLFNGRKQGVFNTNTANGVRASILTFNNSETKGFRLTHLIRFRTDERDNVININYVKEQLGTKKQDLKRPLKCFKELEFFVENIESELKISSLLAEEPTDYCVHVNSSARYFIVGSSKQLSRNGTMDLYAKDEESFYKLYALLNSSYAYLWWRMLDGGILIPKSLLLDIPLPSNDYLKEDVVAYCKDLIKNEKKYLVYKKNAGVMQESIKFPEYCREKLNEMMFGNIPFELIHSNKEIF